MALQLEHTDIEDPFADSSIFSLLPRTLGITSVEPADAPKTHELDYFQSFIKSLTIKGSKELLDQAHVINKTSSSILSLYSDRDKFIVENGKGQPQVRRLALGRKRAQFSLKSDSRAPLASVDVNSSIDHIEDPEEYFLAFEKLENAGKELKKLRGDVSNELPSNHSSPATRNRRPGILGKTASYKHHFPSQDEAVTTIPQDGISDKTLHSPSRTSDNTFLGDVLKTRETDKPGPLVDRVTVTESIAEKESNVDHILDELLSSFKDVDGNEEVSFLREKLQIRSIDVGKVSLPEFTSSKRVDAGIVKNISRKAEGSLQGMSSPILLSSPLAAISILQRRIPLKSPVRDPYSMHLSDDIEYAGGSSLIGGEGQQHYPVGTDYSDISGSLSNIASTPVGPSGKRQKSNNKLPAFNGEMNSGGSPLIGGLGQPHYPIGIDHSDISGSLSDIASTPVRSSGKRQKANNKLQALSGEMNLGKKTASEELLTRNNSLALERNTLSPPKGFNIDNDIMPVELDSCLQEEGNNVTGDAAQPEQPEPGLEDPTSGHLIKHGTDCLAEPPSARFGESADASPSRHDHASQEEVDDVTGAAPVSSTPQGPEGNSTGTQATILPTDEQSEESRAIPEGNSEERDLPANSETLKSGTKRKAHSPKRKKPNPASKRYSLAGAGTTWNAGLRRSTRIKSRPLEYWCGERFIYGRVHDSLATVIGVKYASPSNPQLKVKSFVSDEYADLVAKASLY